MNPNASTLEQWLWIGVFVLGGVGTLQLLWVLHNDWKGFLLGTYTGYLFIAAIYFLLFIIAIQLQ